MGIITRFAQIDKKFAWSFLGFLLAALFGGIAIYTEFIRDNSPIIRYDVLSNTKILDVKEDIGELSIIYNKEDIKKSKKTLSVLALKVSNEGRSAVLKSFYDASAPLGFVINSGEIIKSEIINASTSYLQGHAKANIVNSRAVNFSDVIIEPNEFFIAKFLILNPANMSLTVSPTGKVASVKKVILSDQLTEQKSESFFSRVTSGSFWVQLVRVPVYLFGFTTAMLIIFGPIAFISSKVDERRRNKIVKQFQSYTSNKYDALNAKVYEFYKERGLHTLLRMKNAVVDEEKFASFIVNYNKSGIDYQKIDDHLPEHLLVVPSDFPLDESPNEKRRGIYPARLLKHLIDIGVVLKNGDSFNRSDEHIKAMIEFIDFVVIKES